MTLSEDVKDLATLVDGLVNQATVCNVRHDEIMKALNLINAIMQENVQADTSIEHQMLGAVRQFILRDLSYNERFIGTAENEAGRNHMQGRIEALKSCLQYVNQARTYIATYVKADESNV